MPNGSKRSKEAVGWKQRSKMVKAAERQGKVIMMARGTASVCITGAEDGAEDVKSCLCILEKISTRDISIMSRKTPN